MKTLLCILLLAVSQVASANIILVDQSNNGDVDGIGWSNTGNTSWTLWDDFTVTEDVKITSVNYWHRISIPTSLSLRLGIGSTANSYDVADIIINDWNQTAANSFGDFMATVSGLNVNLASGTYWLTLNGNGLSNPFGSHSATNGNAIQVYNNGSSVANRTGYASTFQLFGTVEASAPATASIVLMSFIAMCLRRKLRNQA
jgi:hypothetical protein